MNLSPETLLALLGVQSVVLLVSLVFNWRLTELAHQREIRIESLIPVEALKTFGEAAVEATRNVTANDTAKWNDFVPGALQQMLDFALGEVQKERTIAVTLEEMHSEEGLG